MRKMTLCFMLSAMLSLGLVSGLNAGTMPNVEKALKSWDGVKEVHLVTQLSDPFASAELLPLIEIFLQYDFAVNMSQDQSQTSKGLQAEVRSLGDKSLIILTRVADNSVIAIERQVGKSKAVESTKSAATVGQVKSAPPPRQQLKQPASQPPAQQSRQRIPIQLEDKPTSLVLLKSSKTDGDTLALLSKSGVYLYLLKGKMLQNLDVAPPPAKRLRPIALSRGDIDGDGSYELSAIWADDISSIYEGTNSRIQSQLLSVQRQKLTNLGKVDGYVRLLDDGGFVQQRSNYKAFSGAVKSLDYQGGRFAGGKKQSWAKRNLFAMTPWTEKYGLALTEQGSLTVVSLASGESLPGSRIIEDFGTSRIAEIAVRREEPEYRSGFEKEDKIFEDYVRFPPRIIRYNNDSMFLIYRGRMDKSIIFGGPRGEDRLTMLKKDLNELNLSYPLPPVSAFIIDFATIDKVDGIEALLLINDKADGEGRAFLLRQEAN